MRAFVTKWRIPLLGAGLVIVILIVLLVVRGERIKKVEAGAWVTNVCNLVEEYEKSRGALTQQAGAVDPRNPQASKTELTRIFGEMNDLRLEFRDDVEAAGMPDVDGGEDIRTAFLERFEAGGEIIAKLREGAEKVDVSSPQNFQKSVQEVVATSGDLPDLQGNLKDIAAREPEAQQVIDLIAKDQQCATFLYMRKG
jgi:hypothetical protein